jgi:hypothetical protein
MRALVHMRVSASMAYILINNGFLIADFIIWTLCILFS